MTRESYTLYSIVKNKYKASSLNFRYSQVTGELKGTEVNVSQDKRKPMNVSGRTTKILFVSHKDEDVTRDDTWDEESKLTRYRWLFVT